jgi:alpha-glucoside transport system substrate-binding protein
LRVFTRGSIEWGKGVESHGESAQEGGGGRIAANDGRRIRVKRRSWLAALAVGILASAIAAIAAYSAQAKPNAKKAGEIEVLSLWGGSEKAAFLKVTSAFTKSSGIKVTYTTARDFEPAIRTRLAAGNPPDVAIIPRPGVLESLAKQGALKDMSSLGLGTAYLNARYDKGLTQLVTFSGKVYGIPAKGNSKSVVWYRPDQFKKYGLKPATTWAQLLAMTKKLKAKGQNPWAQGAKDSWTLTDWFENAYIRTAGPTKYTSLFTGKVKFTDASVKTALRDMLQILTGKYLVGGINGSLGTGFVDGIGRVFGTNAKAQLYMEGGFVGGIATQQVNTKLKPGKTINSFSFPSIKPGSGKYVIFGGDYTSVFKDNADVRKFLKYISSPGAGQIWVSTGAIISPNKQVKITGYPNLLVKNEARQISTAKAVRFDGSDLLPGSLADEWGATLQNIFQKPGNVNSLLSDFQKKADKEF